MYRVAMTGLVVILAIAVMVIIGQRTGGDGDGGDVAPVDRLGDGGEPPPCPDPVGQPTQDIVDQHGGALDADSCVDAAGNSGYIVANYDCTDGRTLYFDATGWGYTGGTWQAHTTAGRTNPPDAEEQACIG